MDIVSDKLMYTLTNSHIVTAALLTFRCWEECIKEERRRFGKGITKYRFFGVGPFDSCYCMTGAPKSTTEVKMEECNNVCSGSKQKNCGGWIERTKTSFMNVWTKGM